MRHTLLILLTVVMTVCCAKPNAPSGSAATTEAPNPVPTSTPTPPVVTAPAGVPQNLYSTAVAYYEANLKNIPNQRYLTIVDFSKWSGNIRMWVIDMRTNTVESALHVAHGVGSDPNNTGYAVSFGNVPNSYKSSLGFYLTDQPEPGANGQELVIDGLSTTNSNARARAILVHGAPYVYDQNVQAGRSEGCFAFPIAHRDHVIGELKGGSLLYAGLSGVR